MLRSWGKASRQLIWDTEPPVRFLPSQLFDGSDTPVMTRSSRSMVRPRGAWDILSKRH